MRKILKLPAFLASILGFLLFSFFAYTQSVETINLHFNGVLVRGQVVDYETYETNFKKRHGVKTNVRVGSVVHKTHEKKTMYKAVIEFKTFAGEVVRFSDTRSGETPLYKNGEILDIIYLPDDLASAQVERGSGNWIPSIFLSFFALLCLFFMVKTIKVFRYK